MPRRLLLLVHRMRASEAARLRRGDYITCHVGGHLQVAKVHHVEREKYVRQIVCFFQRQDGRLIQHRVRHQSADVVSGEDLATYRSQNEYGGRLQFDVPDGIR